MKALLLESTGSDFAQGLRIADVPDPEATAGAVVIRVEACGLCRSNLHMAAGDWADIGIPGKLPIIPGHEIVGRVVARAADVTHIDVGDRVGLGPIWSTCSRCRFCISGREQLCRDRVMTGETIDGGFAELIQAPASHVIPVPDKMGAAEAAVLFCPGLTGYAAVAKAGVTVGSRCAVIGLGGVGHMALQFAREAGAHTGAVSGSARGRQLAETLQADQIVDPASVGDGDVRAGFDSVIVCAPSDAAIRQALSLARPGGTVVVTVLGDIGPYLFMDEVRIIGSTLGTRDQMRAVIDLASGGKVRAEVEAMPLDQGVDAFRRLDAGDYRGRLALIP